jgi:hypothetical protein
MADTYLQEKMSRNDSIQKTRSGKFLKGRGLF